MAERRMFAKSIIVSDEFLDMPATTRCLYFTLCMFADDDGFVNNPKSIMRQTNSALDDMNILVTKKFVIPFEDGVIVIKHWKIHNYIQSDRKKETKYAKDKATLFLDENKAYTQNIQSAKYTVNGELLQPKNGVDTECIQVVSKMDTQVSIGKDSIDIYNERTNINKNNILSSACVCERACACEGEEDSNEKPSEPFKPYTLKPLKSYDDVMDDCQVPIEVRPAVSEFIKHCILNKHVLTNDKLMDILVTLDMQNTDNAGKIAALKAAISGGYYDVKHI